MSIKTFFVKPVERHSAQDRHLQEAVYSKNGRILEKKMLLRTKAITQSGESCPDILSFIKDQLDYTKYDTGLNELTTNPWKINKEEEVESQVEFLINEYGLAENLWRTKLAKVVKQDKISEQVYGEIRFGLVPDELTSAVPKQRATKDNPDVRTRIQKTKCVLYDRTNLLCEDNLEGWLKIKMLKRRPDMVAYPHTSANSAMHNWYLIEASEDQKLTTSTNLLKNKAIGRLADYSTKYPLTNILEDNVLYLIASVIQDKAYKPLIKGKVTATTIDAKLNDFLQVKTKEEIELNVGKFNDVLDMYEKNIGLFYTKYLVQQGLNTNVLQISNSNVFWKGNQDNVEWYKFTSVEAFQSALFVEMERVESPIFRQYVDTLLSMGVAIPTSLTL